MKLKVLLSGLDVWDDVDSLDKNSLPAKRESLAHKGKENV